MSYPVIESVTETNFASDTTSHAVAMPATVNAGDALIVIITNDGSATVTTPGGWAQLYTLANGTALRGGAYAKVASGSEGGTTVDFVTSATETAAAQVYRISGWKGLVAGIEAATPGQVTTGTTADPPALAPSWGSAATVWLATCHTSTTQNVSTGPTSYTDLTQTTSGSGTTYSQCISARRSNTTASEDPDVFTLSGTGASKVYSTIGIAPKVTGALSAAESGSDTVSATGKVTVQGAFAAVESGSDTLASSGKVIVTGALSAAEIGSDTFSASGTVGASTVSGSFAAAESGSDSFAAVGAVIVRGSLAATETGNDTAALSGSVKVSGALSASESGADTLAAVSAVSAFPAFSVLAAYSVPVISAEYFQPEIAAKYTNTQG